MNFSVAEVNRTPRVGNGWQAHIKPERGNFLITGMVGAERRRLKSFIVGRWPALVVPGWGFIQMGR